MKPAFTLVEILVVLAIIAMLLGAAVNGLGQLRGNMEAEQATVQLMSYLQQQQNQAKNNVIDYNNLPPAVSSGISNKALATVIHFDSTTPSNVKIQQEYCWKDLGSAATWIAAITTGKCTTASDIPSIAGVTYTSLTPSPVPVPALSNPCKYVVFENLTEQVYTYDSTNTLLDNSSLHKSCRINIETQYFKNPNPPYKYLNFLSNGSYNVTAP